MNNNLRLSRREFGATLGAALLFPAAAAGQPARVTIRTVTAGFNPTTSLRLDGAERAVEFLRAALERYRSLGYTVQTLRMATPPLTTWLPDRAAPRALNFLRKLDRFAIDSDVLCSVGPVVDADFQDRGIAQWVADLLRDTSQLSMSAIVASPPLGVHQNAITAAAETITALASVAPAGVANFRFCASAFVPPGTPFFPAAYYVDANAFSVGLESPPMLRRALIGAQSVSDARDRLAAQLQRVCADVARHATELGSQWNRSYLGIDTSPAPGIDASVGEVIEALSGVALGEASTLAACATLTSMLQELDIASCGYSGLMLPVLEDPVLARRAAQGRIGISDLLLYSSVCGTGLDVVPLPGDTSTPDVARLIHDVAALAARYRKPLSARLLPVPGKRAGEIARFDDPYLIDTAVMSLDG